MTHLKTAHYEAMRGLGYTDEEIEKDWEVFVREYEEYLALMSVKTDEYRPFGSSVPAKKLSAEEVKEPMPW
jgi:hypothetical protein